MTEPTASETPLVLSRIDGAVATLTLNRPERRNCLSSEMMGALHAAFDDIAGRRDVKVVILAASGPVFCSGHDLKELASLWNAPDGGRTAYKAVFDQCAALMLRIIRLPQPVIAKVQGIATAAGCQLVATCDLAVASSEASFATPGVNIGLFCSTPMVALSRNVSRKPAMEMLLTGEPIPAEEAVRHGLINRAVAPETLDHAAHTLALKIAQKSRHVVEMGKEAFYVQAEKSLPEAYAFTAEVMTRNMMTHDAEEGISAFLEKREPEWEDR